MSIFACGQGTSAITFGMLTKATKCKKQVSTLSRTRGFICSLPAVSIPSQHHPSHFSRNKVEPCQRCPFWDHSAVPRPAFCPRLACPAAGRLPGPRSHSPKETRPRRSPMGESNQLLRENGVVDLGTFLGWRKGNQRNSVFRGLPFSENPKLK